MPCDPMKPFKDTSVHSPFPSPCFCWNDVSSQSPCPGRVPQPQLGAPGGQSWGGVEPAADTAAAARPAALCLSLKSTEQQRPLSSSGQTCHQHLFHITWVVRSGEHKCLTGRAQHQVCDKQFETMYSKEPRQTAHGATRAAFLITLLSFSTPRNIFNRTKPEQ